jgi:hypothetical protein
MEEGVKAIKKKKKKGRKIRREGGMGRDRLIYKSTDCLAAIGVAVLKWVRERNLRTRSKGQNQYFPLLRLFVFRLFCLGFRV